MTVSKIRLWLKYNLPRYTLHDLDESWSEGYHCDDEVTEEFIAHKDSFIEQQAEIIDRLMHVITKTNTWEYVPEDLRDQLRNYV